MLEPNKIHKCKYVKSQNFKNKQSAIKFMNTIKFPFITNRVDAVVFIYEILED